MYIPAGTDTALFQTQGYMKKSLVRYKWHETSLHTQEKPRNTCNQYEAARKQGILTALVGFLDRTLDLSFSGSPACSLFSESFTVLCISFSGATEKKMRVLQNLLMLSITCYYLFVITCYTASLQVICWITCYTIHTLVSANNARFEHLQYLQEPVLSEKTSMPSQVSNDYHMFWVLKPIYINLI